MTWLVLAVLYALLLGASFGRGVRHLRLVRRNRPVLQDTDEEWRRRALDIVLVGSGDVTIGAKLVGHRGTSAEFVFRATNGVEITVPAGTYLEIGTHRVRVVDGMFVARADLTLTAYVSSFIPDEGVMRTALRLPPETKLILVDRGAAPIANLMEQMQRTWRPERVALFIGGAAALVAWAAVSTTGVWLAALAVIGLAVDLAFLGSAFVMLNCTRRGAHQSRTS